MAIHMATPSEIGGSLDASEVKVLHVDGPYKGMLVVNKLNEPTLDDAIAAGQVVVQEGAVIVPTPPVFSVNSITPNSVVATAGVTLFTINGTAFDATTQVDVSGNGWNQVPFTLVSSTAITFSVNIAVEFGPGPVHIDVRQGASGTPQRVTFQITAAP